MAFVKILVLAIVIGLIGWGIYDLTVEKKKLAGELNKLSASLQTLEAENELLSMKVEYFKHPENLLKELKAQFNYREDGENLIIIVPSSTSTR